MPVRPYRPADAPAIAALFHASVTVLGPRRYTPEQVAAWSPAVADPARWHAQFSDGRTVLVSQTEAGALDAFATLEPDGHLDHLYRAPDAAPGVAEALLDTLLAHATRQGIARLHTEASALARGLFERKGFTMIERRQVEMRGVAIWNCRMEQG